MSQFTCPTCGATLKVIPLRGVTSSSSSWKAGQTLSLGAGVGEGVSYSREVPTADMSGMVASVQAPLFQSGVTALAAGAVSVGGVLWMNWEWFVPLAVTVAVFGLSWWFLLTSNRRLLSVVERVDRPEAARPTTFNVEVTESFADGQKRMRFAQFPASERDTKRFAIAALNQRLTVHGGHGLSQGAFAKMRDESIGRGLLVWRNQHAHNQGVELTRVGQRVFERLSD